MHEGKAQRVIGFFLFMLGSGVILDSQAEAAGAGVAACGVALFAWGFFLSRNRAELRGRTAEGSEQC